MGIVQTLYHFCICTQEWKLKYKELVYWKVDEAASWGEFSALLR
jgi:hypothetical protein